MNRQILFLCSFVIGFFFVCPAGAWTPMHVDDDPLVRMPGTQPSATAMIASPSHETKGGGSPNYACVGCHKGEPATPADQGMPFFKWQGSMMAQAARDPIFWATMTVAAQDSIWAVGRPNATDICLRCHFPEGWMSERSSIGSDQLTGNALNASAMQGSDYDGVHCGVCHRMYDPFAQATNAGTREGGINQQAYWDETTSLSAAAADTTAAADSLLAQAVDYFNVALGSLFDTNGDPLEAGYTENGGGQMFMDLVSSPWDNMRGPFADPLATAHEANDLRYSRYHKSKYFCSTCHDVSNPVLANLGQDGLTPLTTETDAAHTYAHVERTFSEFMSSAYGQDNGFPTNIEFQNLGGPAVAASCQDCHMQTVTGLTAASGGGIPVRPDDSTEHSNTGLHSHDLQGGNMWITQILASLDESLDGIGLYDLTNLNLLDQGTGILTLDLSQGISMTSDSFGAALLAASDRARMNLLRAASIKNIVYNSATGLLSFRVQNNTGHKLLTGYPEGRRMFLNIKAFSDQDIVYEINPYDSAAGTFKGGLSFWTYNGDDGLAGTVVPPPASLGPNEEFMDALVYEAATKSDLTGEDHSFHFALSTDRYKDNRIPPRFFNLAEAQIRLSEPVANGAIKDTPGTPTNLYSEAEYAGGYDDVSVTIPMAAYKNITHVQVNLYYQGTSREYVEFLRDEINGTGANRALYGPDNVIGLNNVTYYDTIATVPNGDNAYLVQSPLPPSADFFSGLKAWGDTIWQLWYHNHGLDGSTASVDGIVPFEMVSTQVAGENTAIYTLELSGGGIGAITDTASSVTLCDKPTAAPVTCNIPYVINSAIDYTAVPGINSAFGGYTGSALINGVRLTDTVTADETIQATFLPTVPPMIIYTLELLGDGMGHIEDTSTKAVLCNKATADPMICSLNYTIGTSIGFTAVTAPRSAFDGFTGDAIINGKDLQDTTTVDETIQASFRSVPPMNIALEAAVISAAKKGEIKK